MQVEHRKLDSIKPYEKNPRRNDKAVDNVANSIKEFGFRSPIIVDKKGVIIAGHTRYKAAQKLGLKEVPCLVASDLTKAQIKAYRLADNKTAELAEWDFELLHDELEGLTQDFDFDMKDFGFYIPDQETFDHIFEDRPQEWQRSTTESETEMQQQEEQAENMPVEAPDGVSEGVSGYTVIVSLASLEAATALAEALRNEGHICRVGGSV